MDLASYPLKPRLNRLSQTSQIKGQRPQLFQTLKNAPAFPIPPIPRQTLHLIFQLTRLSITRSEL